MNPWKPAVRSPTVTTMATPTLATMLRRRRRITTNSIASRTPTHRLRISRRSIIRRHTPQRRRRRVRRGDRSPTWRITPPTNRLPTRRHRCRRCPAIRRWTGPLRRYTWPSLRVTRRASNRGWREGAEARGKIVASRSTIAGTTDANRNRC